MPGARDQMCDDVVDRLIALYEETFGGKQRGRYRISMKLMCRFFEQRRLWPEQIEALRRCLYERGSILVDLETYFAIVSQQTFVSYRRVNETAIAALDAARSVSAPGSDPETDG